MRIHGIDGSYELLSDEVAVHGATNAAGVTTDADDGDAVRGEEPAEVQPHASPPRSRHRNGALRSCLERRTPVCNESTYPFSA
jgi:hypothetical protein